MALGIFLFSKVINVFSYLLPFFPPRLLAFSLICDNSLWSMVIDSLSVTHGGTLFWLLAYLFITLRECSA
jgi:hypothetical protein